MPTTVHAYAAPEAGKPFETFEYELPDELGHDEVEVEVHSCGLCHSDLSMLDNDWGMSKYPFVGGHEVSGVVARVGQHVPKLKEGDKVGVGWFTRSCMHCRQCLSGKQNRCPEGEGTIVGRHGGFADRLRAHWAWCVPVPESVDAGKVGPMFCGGITAFTPFINHNINALSRVGVIGIGGLGHLALQFSKGFGAETVAFSTSPDKEAEAKKLGADRLVNVKEDGALDKLAGAFDLILNTTNARLDWDAYVNCLKPGGVLHTVGAVTDTFGVSNSFPMIMGEKSLSASPLGPPVRAMEMLDFAGRHGIAPVTQHHKLANLNDAFEALRSGSPRYRLVLDVA
ncbi:MAG: NAD(P)-dependent alcohol dehydrogenase [Planctomycetota bacterium]